MADNNRVGIENNSKEQRQVKAVQCLCGSAYIMKCYMPEAEEDPLAIEEFETYKSKGYKIVYIPLGETQWHNNKECVKELLKYKTACESINKDNPMAVAELLPEIFDILPFARDVLKAHGYTNGYEKINELLTKTESK